VSLERAELVNLERAEIRFAEHTLDFLIQRNPRRKHLKIIVTKNQIEVLTPSVTPLEHISKAVYKAAPRILDHQKRLTSARVIQDPKKQWISGECIRYLGRQYILKRIMSTPQPVRLRGRYFEISAFTNTEARATTTDWYHTRAVQRLEPRVTMWAERLGLETPKIRIAHQQKRWGSCSVDRILRLNWRLMLMPWSLIDYVIAHELCHLLEPNHATKFWLRLRQVMPDYPQRRQKLALEGQLYMLE
jgi:predicted metal-dependent hydrolase